MVARFCIYKSVPPLPEKRRVSNRHRNAKRNPNLNQETIVLGLLSFEILKRDLQQQFPDSDLDFVSHSDDDSRRVFSGRGGTIILGLL